MMSCLSPKNNTTSNIIKHDSDKIPQIEEVFNTMKSDGFTGTILIAEKGNIVFSDSYGYTNLIDSIQINQNTMFELASVSK